MRNSSVRSEIYVKVADFEQNIYATNTGSSDMKMFWVFFPPGLEDWFNAIGRQRIPGDPMPEPFARPDNVQDVMDRMRFLPPRTRD